jgi:hypothetical protein
MYNGRGTVFGMFLPKQERKRIHSAAAEFIELGSLPKIQALNKILNDVELPGPIAKRICDIIDEWNEMFGDVGAGVYE